jgi:AcrR family transcriptional regulator
MTARAQDTRRRLLLAAARVLAESEAASMADIAASAKHTRGTLYHHFPSRESLIPAARGALPSLGFSAPLAALLER